jgi:hypothetical protein
MQQLIVKFGGTYKSVQTFADANFCLFFLASIYELKRSINCVREKSNKFD